MGLFNVFTFRVWNVFTQHSVECGKTASAGREVINGTPLSWEETKQERGTEG